MIPSKSIRLLAAGVALSGAAALSSAPASASYTEYGWSGSTIALPTPPATPNPTYVWVFDPQSGRVSIYYEDYGAVNDEDYGSGSQQG